MDKMEEKHKIYDSSRGCTTQRADNGELLCSYHPGCCKLHDFNWLKGINDPKYHNLYEVRFKNTRKGFYENTSRQLLKTYRHSQLIAGSALFGMLILVAGQLIVEHVYTYAIPISVFITVGGGLYFLYLLLTKRRV